MTTAIAFLLAATFLISVGGLALLIWALANDQFTMGPRAARTIFGPGEVGGQKGAVHRHNHAVAEAMAELRDL